MNKYKGLVIGQKYQARCNYARSNYVRHRNEPVVFVSGNMYELIEITINSHGDVLLEFKTEKACNLKISPSRAQIIFGGYCL